MATSMYLRLFLVTGIVLTCISWVAAGEGDLQELGSKLRLRLEEHLDKNRHHDVNEFNKDNVRNYIKESLEGCHLKVELQEFSGTNDEYEGVNIVGVLEGKFIGTPQDNVVLLGAHYDTTATTPGVDDNGSGVALLLEAAVMVTKGLCEPVNTVMFVAFDLEEYQTVPDDISVGSKHFVNEWLEPFLNISQTARSQFQGALIMETILNYNNTNSSQEFPQEVFLLPQDVYQHMESRGFPGDFITVIGRETDADFSAKFTSHLSEVEVPGMYTEVFELPFEGVPAPEHEAMLGNFFRSDHVRFWKSGPPYLPALFITDTANFRHPMTTCYHEACDSREVMITEDNLLFLARTTKAATNMLIELGNDTGTNCPVGAAQRTHSNYALWYSVITAIVFIISV